MVYLQIKAIKKSLLQGLTVRIYVCSLDIVWHLVWRDSYSLLSC